VSAVRGVLTCPERVSVTFQPIFDISHQRTAGWEILARVEGGSPAGPDRWFAAAYSADLGIQLEAVVLRQAMAAYRLRSPGTFMAVNVTPAALGVPMIEELIAGQAPLHGLVIELTEHLVPPVGGCWQAACARLRALGALVAIDDVGTGYAEISQILELRPQIIKVDRGVITSIENDPARQALLRFLGDFGDQLDAWVLAEGVETPAQLQILKDLGVPLAQGWLIGAPAPTPRPCSDHLTGRDPLPAAWPAKGTRSRHVRVAMRVEDVMRPARVATAWQVPGVAEDRASPETVTASGSTAAGEPRPVVALDAAGMPTMVMAPVQPARPQGWSPVSLRVPVHLSLPEAARRAMARPEGFRFDPLICVDATGIVLGVVAMHDLMLALAAPGAAPQ
jgi:EAL domain-containing protein (putative c-di-GMP-specific phosphodiesterase class I)